MAERTFLKACEPPWVVFPEIQPAELSRYLKQGATELWFDESWRPFWSALGPEQQQQYLDHWPATPAWREAMASFFDMDGDLDLDADAQESEEYLAQWRLDHKK